MTEIKRNRNNEKLIKAVNYLALEFPVAEISEKLEVDKGNVSAYLNNKKSVSSNFIKKFEKAFNISTDDFESKLETKNPQQSEGELSSLNKIIEIQAKEIEFLRELLLKK